MARKLIAEYTELGVQNPVTTVIYQNNTSNGHYSLYHDKNDSEPQKVGQLYEIITVLADTDLYDYDCLMHFLLGLVEDYYEK